MSAKLEELVGKPITLEQFDEAAGKKDACYHKVRARYDVWPSAYASGALVKCRKVGAKNWGNKSKKESIDETIKERFTPNTSMTMIQNLSTLNDRFSGVTNFLLSENEFIVNNNKVEFDLPNSYPVFSEDRANFNELLISLFEIENNLKFKVFDSEVDNQSIQNVVLKFSNFENSLNALSILSKFENISLRKAFLEDNSNSVHLYISIKK